jgi:RimJ/RimL family protein N-acetyltransferase
MTLPVLHGPRLSLRAMEADDAPALFAIYGDPEVMAYTDEPPFPDLATVDLMLASVRRLLASGESLEWAIVLDQQVIGTCGLHSFELAPRSAQVGCLLRRDHWGQGHMAHAIGLLARYAGDVLRLQSLAADVAPDNQRAQRLFRKLGYQPDGSGLLRIRLSATSAA